METAKHTLSVPETFIPYLEEDNTQMELTRNAMILLPYIKNETISHGKAAQMLGIPKIELIQLYGSYGIPYIDMSVEEFEAELEALRIKRRKLTKC